MTSHYPLSTLEGKIKIKHGFAFKGEYFSSNGRYILLTPGNIYPDGGFKLNESKEKYYNGNFPISFLFEKGDLVTVMTDLTQEASILGGAFIIPESNRFLHNQRLGKIEIVDDHELDTKFLYYCFNFEFFRGQVRGSASGTTVKHTAPERIYRCYIPLPPLPIQQRIASILSAYDDLIEVNNQRIKLLEETARELYKEWFVRMRFPGYQQTTFVRGVPEGWELNTCYSFADVKGGGTPSTNNPEYWEGEINFFTPTDHHDSFYIFETEKRITENGLSNSSTKLFPKYSTFITARGTVGNICLAGNHMAMNQSCFGIVPHSKIDCFFLFLFVDEMVRYLKLVATGATFDAITLKTFNNYRALIPDISLREIFHDMASPIFFQIENLIQQNTQLRQIRDRLLPRLISGKLEVK
jgi:type I restriction enzyme S subunit